MSPKINCQTEKSGPSPCTRIQQIRYKQGEYEEMNIFVPYSLFHTCIIHSRFPKAEPRLLMKLHRRAATSAKSRVDAESQRFTARTKRQSGIELCFMRPFFSLISLVSQSVFSAAKLYNELDFWMELNSKRECCKSCLCEWVCVCVWACVWAAHLDSSKGCWTVRRRGCRKRVSCWTPRLSESMIWSFSNFWYLSVIFLSNTNTATSCINGTRLHEIGFQPPPPCFRTVPQLNQTQDKQKCA